ncbi:MAG: hypothetical protein ABIN18_23490 [Pseudomonadota bacterium]
MKTFSIFIGALLLGGAIGAQNQAHQATVINIEVPVRVFDHGKFVESLTRDDFFITENGIPQKIEALYLVKSTDIERQETLRDINPELSRKFNFICRLTDYNPGFEEATKHFLENIVQSGDTLDLYTPMKHYFLNKNVLMENSREKIAKDMNTILKRDINAAGKEYNSLTKELKRIVRSIRYCVDETCNPTSFGMEGQDVGALSGLDFLLSRYFEIVRKRESLSAFNEKTLLSFLGSLKNQGNQNVVFFIYQKEYLPVLEQRYIGALADLSPEGAVNMTQMNNIYKNKFSNLTEIEQIAADSGVLFNFIYINNKESSGAGIEIAEIEQSTFSALTKTAESTGGVTSGNANLAESLKKAASAAENYYLLYYTPTNSPRNGDFKNIKVEVKNKDLSVKHKKGYFSD